jgi:hypothetical protein
MIVGFRCVQPDLRTDKTENEIMTMAFMYGNAALHPMGLNLDRKDAPSNWGNNRDRAEYFREYPLEERTKLGTGTGTVVYYYHDNWYAYSTNQASNWPDLNVDQTKKPK